MLGRSSLISRRFSLDRAAQQPERPVELGGLLGIGRGDLVARPGDVHVDRGQVAAELVVQVARDDLLLVLAHVQQVTGQMRQVGGAIDHPLLEFGVVRFDRPQRGIALAQEPMHQQEERRQGERDDRRRDQRARQARRAGRRRGRRGACEDRRSMPREHVERSARASSPRAGRVVAARPSRSPRRPGRAVGVERAVHLVELRLGQAAHPVDRGARCAASSPTSWSISASRTGMRCCMSRYGCR